MIKLAKLVKEIMTVPPMNHVQPVSTNIFSADFINYIKAVENSIKKGRAKEGQWFPYKDPAGWHIGYGHKIKTTHELKAFRKGISDADTDKLLIDDLRIANKVVQDYIKNHYDVAVMLNKTQTEMLVDFAYNLGNLDKFPKFVDAVLHNDKATIKQEYQRKVGDQDLTGRNAAFYNRFLK